MNHLKTTFLLTCLTLLFATLASALTKLQTAVRDRPMGEVATATAHLFIVSPLAGKNLRSLFATHPPVEARVRRLEALAGSGR